MLKLEVKKQTCNYSIPLKNSNTFPLKVAFDITQVDEDFLHFQPTIRIFFLASLYSLLLSVLFKTIYSQKLI